MSRYLLRSLIAVSTFLLGIGVSAVIHPFGSTHWRQNPVYVYDRRHCHREMSFSMPTLSIDSVATDPVKLAYGETRAGLNSGTQQVLLLLNNETEKPINAVNVRFSSQRPAFPGRKNGWIRVPFGSRSTTSNSESSQTVAFNCDSADTVSVWISTVEFKDGSAWINPRRPNETSF